MPFVHWGTPNSILKPLCNFKDYRILCDWPEVSKELIGILLHNIRLLLVQRYAYQELQDFFLPRMRSALKVIQQLLTRKSWLGLLN